MLDQGVSWLYYPEGALRMRLVGQLILTKIVETCILNGWKVLSVNTDGCTSIVPKKQFDDYKKEMSLVEKQFNLELEHEKYKFIYYSHVNAYIAQTESEKVKRKGFYQLKEELDLGDSVNELVIPKALSNYFIDNIPIEETIKNPEKYGLNIFDYCKSNKISKDYEVWWNNQVQQNLNRYYFSKPGPFLFKRKKEGAKKRKINATFEHVNVGNPVILFNNYEQKSLKDYNINYNYYIAKTREIIDSLYGDQRQQSLF